MSKKNTNKNSASPEQEQELKQQPAAAPADTAEVTEETAAPADKDTLIAELQAAVEHEKKEYLFLMADFDNYRKRTLKEKQDLIKNGAERAMRELLPIVDDFERALAAMGAGGDVDSLREGVELIHSKFVKYLQQNGVTPIESTGADFDPELHEAVTMFPAPDESQKGKVIDTTTRGYMIHDKVLRHAKVVVGQ
ncbi:MAG: nucleotide exchange factor GrpE [Muribaculaceae bacterium]|jgi:molecular chaperone GrpE|nr:nucleotide exchange factor GrpE [Muribaculaceae bacterium]